MWLEWSEERGVGGGAVRELAGQIRQGLDDKGKRVCILS